MKFHAYEWNDHNEELVMVVLTEEDIETKNYKDITGCGYEIVVLPKKFENVDNEYLSHIRAYLAAKVKGRLIYI